MTWACVCDKKGRRLPLEEFDVYNGSSTNSRALTLSRLEQNVDFDLCLRDDINIALVEKCTLSSLFPFKLVLR